MLAKTPLSVPSRVALISALIAVCHLTLSGPQPLTDFTGKPAYPVVRVVDGDTVVVDIDGRETTVRLIGVDTPETVHPNKPVQVYGQEASTFVKNLLLGESVYLEYEPGPHRNDHYGRTLAYLYRVPDGLFVNLEIVRQGYGHAYAQYPFKYLEVFRQSEAKAREAGGGLWGAAPPQTEEAATPPTATQKTGEQADIPVANSLEEFEALKAQGVPAVKVGDQVFNRVGTQYLRAGYTPSPKPTMAPRTSYDTDPRERASYESGYHEQSVPRDTAPRPYAAENGDIRGADNDGDGRSEPVHVKGYYRKDGTYVRGHYRARPSRR